MRDVVALLSVSTVLMAGFDAKASQPVLDPLPFVIRGIDYNSDSGTSPAPYVDLTRLQGATITQMVGQFALFPWHELLPQSNGRTLVLDAEFKIWPHFQDAPWSLEVGGTIDITNHAYWFGGGTYHTHWADEPFDDQYGTWSPWECHHGDCQVGTDYVMGEFPPQKLGPYYLNSHPYTPGVPTKFATLSLWMGPLGERVAVAGWPTRNDGTYPPMAFTTDIQIVPHPDGKRTMLRVPVINEFHEMELHHITLESARPLVDWAEVDEWSSYVVSRGAPGSAYLTEHWVNSTPLPALGSIGVPEPATATIAFVSIVGWLSVCRNRQRRTALTFKRLSLQCRLCIA